MQNTHRLLTIREAAELLKINAEVMRRWLRSGRVPGVKIGSDWRIRETDLAELVNPGGRSEPPSTSGEASVRHAGISSPQGPKMCIKSPKWLEYSGLPRQLNDEIGPEAWPVFKKLIEIDFEKGDEEARHISLDLDELSDRVGYDVETVEAVLQALAQRRQLILGRDRKQGRYCEIVTPLRTPRLILDIPFVCGGVQAAPNNALQNRCMRRYLESASPADESSKVVARNPRRSVSRAAKKKT